MTIDFSRFRETFFEEATEHLVVMEEGLLQLEQRPADQDLLNRIFRGAHSIKGSSALLGFEGVAAFTHTMETVLDRLRSGIQPVTKGVIDALLVATDGLKHLIAMARLGERVSDEVVASFLVGLDEFVPAGTGASRGTATVPSTSDLPLRRLEITWRAPQDLFLRGLNPAGILCDLSELGTITECRLDLSRLPDITDLDPERCFLSWRVTLDSAVAVVEVERVFEFAREGGELGIVDTLMAPATVPSGREVGAAREKRLGELLVEDGVISTDQLAEALREQRPIGQILRSRGAATPKQISDGLEKQRMLRAASMPKSVDGLATSSIRVDTGKIDRLINLVGELVITQSMISDLTRKFDEQSLPVLAERVMQLERNTREIQERVMAVRMVPVRSVFQRFPRLVRDLAASRNKTVRLRMFGEETELDKSVIESIGDPLTHLIRNSVDHGIEAPAERLAIGKPSEGVITLKAFHQGGMICITVEDDGGGLSRERILRRARELGLIGEQEELADDQLWALVFRPGFSTAESVTDVSGRGVGMDVVKRNIDALGGTVSIQTVPGRGTRFSLKFPLTLAIIDGMTVRVGPEIYILPLTSIVESIRPRREHLTRVVGRGQLVNVRGEYLPVFRLFNIFGVPTDKTDPTEAVLVIVEAEGERVAVMVDELLGQQQVVIKNLRQNFRKVEGIAGATILGDGRVALIIDVRGVGTIVREGSGRAEPVPG